MLRSVRITSTGLWLSFSRASTPSEAVSGTIPHAVTMPARPARWLASSSTIMTRSVLFIVPFSHCIWFPRRNIKLPQKGRAFNNGRWGRRALPNRVIVEYPDRRKNPRAGGAGAPPVFLQRRRGAGRAGGLGGHGRRDPDPRVRQSVSGLAMAGADRGSHFPHSLFPHGAARALGLSGGADRRRPARLARPAFHRALFQRARGPGQRIRMDAPGAARGE